MLKAALESLKRKGDTQTTQKTEKKESVQGPSSPLSSQLSALLFSSSPPPEPKQAKVEVNDVKDADASDSFMIEDDLDDLLKELDDVGDNDLFESDVKQAVHTLDYCTEKGTGNTMYSEVDSVYGTQRLLPMIDISTPQIFSQSQNKWEISDIEESQNITTRFKVLLSETFNLEDLKANIRSINVNLHLNPIEAIKGSPERRVSFQLALMLRDFRQMGSMAQLRLLDGNGNEIVGTLALSACTELGIKLHFGLILVLTNVSVFSPVPGQKYLNITKQNIQSFHYNTCNLV